MRSAFRGIAFESGCLAALVLLVSGLTHLSLVWVIHDEWEGALSARTPGLFGISAGLTAASLLWCSKVIGSIGQSVTIASAITWALLLKVTLITIQYWRGVPSHFNRTTRLDAEIELTMIALILGVSVGIGW